MILEFTEHANADLQDISAYTREAWGIEQEERYLKELYQKFAEILEFPARWRFREDYSLAAATRIRNIFH